MLCSLVFPLSVSFLHALDRLVLIHIFIWELFNLIPIGHKIKLKPLSPQEPNKEQISMKLKREKENK